MNNLKTNANKSVYVDEYNAMIYIINSVVNKVKTLELVKVLSLDTERNTLTVMPIIRNANANGDAIEQSEISGVKYIRWQFGGNALKAVPEVGDIGMAVISHKDISNVESGLVGSFRRFCQSDSIYIGGIFGLNAEPTQFIEFGSGGITITSPANITINATGESSEINIEAATTVNLNASSVQVNGNEVAVDGDKVVAGTTVIGAIDTSKRGQE